MKYTPFPPYYIGKKVQLDAENKGFKTEAPYITVEVVEFHKGEKEGISIKKGDVLAIHSIDKGIPIENETDLHIFKDTTIIFKIQKPTKK